MKFKYIVFINFKQWIILYNVTIIIITMLKAICVQSNITSLVVNNDSTSECIQHTAQVCFWAGLYIHYKCEVSCSPHTKGGVERSVGEINYISLPRQPLPLAHSHHFQVSQWSRGANVASWEGTVRASN